MAYCWSFDCKLRNDNIDYGDFMNFIKRLQMTFLFLGFCLFVLFPMGLYDLLIAPLVWLLTGKSTFQRDRFWQDIG